VALSPAVARLVTTQAVARGRTFLIWWFGVGAL